nr:CapA family protein [Propionibacterium sp.]
MSMHSRRAAWRPAAAATLTALALAGCAATPTGMQPVAAPVAGPSGGASTAATTTGGDSASGAGALAGTTQARPPITGSDPITLAFAGDVHFEKDKLRRVANDPEGMATLKPYLAAADITVVNLETAITSGGSPLPGKPFTFRAPASALTTLANAGVDVAGMANNHGADFGAKGLADTLKAQASAPLKVIGVGNNLDEANAPAEFVIDGVTIAILNVTPLQEETTDYHTAADDAPGVAALVKPYTSTAAKRFVAAVEDAARRYDVVVVFIHWGTEGERCPTPKQFEVEKMLSAAGADAIIGGHSHRVQAGGWSGNTYVNYGLGSFTWWLVPSDPATGVLTLTLDKDRVAAKRAAADPDAAASVFVKESWQAMVIGESGLPYVPGKDTVARLNAKRDSLLLCSKLSATP